MNPPVMHALRSFLLLAACLAVCLTLNATNSTGPVHEPQVEIDVTTFDDEDSPSDDHKELVFPDDGAGYVADHMEHEGHPDDYQPSDPVIDYVVGDEPRGSV